MTSQISSAKNLTTHVALVLDRSVSMRHLEQKTIQVADELVAFLANKSTEMNQEWRVSVYSFGNEVDCHIWDMDVLRLPSMKEHYRINGNTALIDATNLALDDGEKITEHRGDHSFLVYVVTDGEENWSTGGKRQTFGLYDRPSYSQKAQLVEALRKRLGTLPDNRTVAVLAPDTHGAKAAQELGFENIFLWDTSSEAGMEAASQAIQTSATTYMEARTKGAEGLRTMRGGLFVGANVDPEAVKKKLKPLTPYEYDLVPVTKVKDKAFEKFDKPTKAYPEGKPLGWFVRIDDFINHVDPPFAIGKGYYQLFSGNARRSEKVQGNKQVAVMDKKTSQVYVGPEARRIVGLPDHDQTVKPGSNPDYEIFVKSTSDNRHLPVGTKLLLLKN